LAQEVFLKVFKSLDMYDTSRPMKAWIARITTNRCLDEMRKGRYSRVQAFSDLTEEEERRIQYYYDQSNRGAGLTETEAEECFTLLHKLMDRLAEKDKVAFVLREVEGLDYEEVARALGTSQLGARIRVSRARRKLQHSLAQLLERQRGL
jgi:RNA polymerase sigma-70 factor (ECF subfamily)